MSHGWASNDGGSKPFPEGSAFQSDDDNLSTSDAKRLTDLTKCLVHDAAASTSPNNTADLHTWDSGGLTLKFETVTARLTYHVIQFGAAGTPFEGGTGVDEGLIALV